MTKRIKRSLALVLTMALLLICFACALPVHAAGKADMAKANVKWDLKNNKEIKFKTTWAVIGAKQHKVKMTDFKVTDADQEGYKKCTFTLTVTRKINPSKKQVLKMAEKGNAGGGFYWAVVDYQTGMSLGADNDKGVVVTSSGWKYSKYRKHNGTNGSWIKYPEKSKVKVTVLYPETYTDLAIGFGGMTKYNAKATAFWNGKKSFYNTGVLWSKKDKTFAHFKRVK